MSSKRRSAGHGGRFFRSFGIAACAAALLRATAFADPVDWTAYKCSFKIAFPGYTGSTTLEDFPVLIRLSAELNDFDYSKCKAENGGDLRFADSEGNLLPSEVDTWNPDGESLVWVRVPSLNATTKIKAYYGCDNPATVNPKDVWSNGYAGVWHMDEDIRKQSDSTVNGKTIDGHSTYQANMAFGADGVIGMAVEQATPLDNGAYRGGFQRTDTDSLYSGTKTLTLEMWCLHRDIVNDKYIIRLKNSQGETEYAARFAWPVSGDDTKSKMQLSWSVLMTNLVDETRSSFDPKFAVTTGGVQNVWTHYALVVDNETLHRVAAYCNGESKYTKGISDAALQLFAGAGTFAVGNSSYGGTQAFPGSIDEVRVSSVARSDDWVRATYDTVHDEGFAVCEQDNDWAKYAYKATIEFPGAPETALTDFPVLVKLAEYDEAEGTGIMGFRYANFVKPDGGDLRFADENGQMLNHEIDTWNESGTSYVWVKIPSLSNSTKITAYYGWKFASAVSSRDVWSNGYIGVWHLGESGLTMADSTQDGVDFTCDPGYADYVGRGVEGLAGNSVEFDLVTTGDKAHYGHLYLKDSNHRYCGRSTMTIEYWLYQRQAASNRRLLYCKTGNDRAYDMYSQTSSGGYDKFTIAFGTTNITTSVTNNPNLTINGQNSDFKTWKYHSVVFDSEVAMNITFYVDGSYRNAKDINEGDIMLPVVQDLRLGNLASGQAFPGKFDEMRISSAARSAEWLKATHDTIAENGSFTSYGAFRENIKGFLLMLR